MTTAPHAPNDWLALLGDAARDLADTDEITNHGEWMTGGGCTAYGACVDHAGSALSLMVTSVDGGAVPDATDTHVAVGVYGNYDTGEQWAVCANVAATDLTEVIDLLSGLVGEMISGVRDMDEFLYATEDLAELRTMVAS